MILKPWLWLVLALYLTLMGCAAGVQPGGKWGGESYPPGWDDDLYYTKQAPG